MPFTGEEQKHVSLVQFRFLLVSACEYTFSLCDVEQLVFVEFAPFFDVEIISVGMASGGIGVARGYLFISYGTHGESPLHVAVVG